MKYNPKQRRKLRATKAYNNNTFLNSREARSLRIQCEMIEPGIRLRREEYRYGYKSTIRAEKQRVC